MKVAAHPQKCQDNVCCAKAKLIVEGEKVEHKK